MELNQTKQTQAEKVARTNGKTVLIKRSNEIETIKTEKQEEYIVDTITENYLKDHINPKKRMVCEGRKRVSMVILQSFLWAGFNTKRINFTSISGFKPCYL